MTAVEWLISELKKPYSDEYIVNIFNKAKQMEQDRLKQEIERAYKYGQANAEMMEAGLERDEIDEYVAYRMTALKKNKQ